MFRGLDHGVWLALCASSGESAPNSSRKAAAGGKQLQTSSTRGLAQHEVDEQAVEAFEADGFVLQYGGNVVGGDEGVGKAETDENAAGWAWHQAHCFENGDAGAFAADQGAGDVEAVLRQQLVEIVAGDAARNFGKARADQVA